jgi:hypothetical protein
MVVRRVFKDSYGSGSDKSYATKYSLLAISETAYLKGEQKANMFNGEAVTVRLLPHDSYSIERA